MAIHIVSGSTVRLLEEVASEEHEVDVLLQGSLDDVQERPAEVIEAFLGAVLLVAEVDVGGMEEFHLGLLLPKSRILLAAWHRDGLTASIWNQSLSRA